MKNYPDLRVAFVGTRGVPANYGGFETCVEEIGRRLVDKGHCVTVYCRNSYYVNKQKEYSGMHLVHLPNLSSKTLDTMSHTFLSVLHALFGKYDICMVFNAANSFFLLPLRLSGKIIAINTDGLEWRRSKWGLAGKTYYKLAEKVACVLANRIVTDSKGMKDYYKKRYGIDSSEIAYGAPIQTTTSSQFIENMGLKKRGYFLQITRFEPENYPLLTIKAFKKLNTKKKLVLVGGNPYPSQYTREIEKDAGGNVLLPGFIYDQDILKELWCNCYAYVHGNSVGGTNPALLQTMASGCFSIASDISFNHDVLDNCGIFYKTNKESLAEKMQWTLDHEDQLDTYRQKAQHRVREHYTWDRIADQYEELFQELVQGKYPWSPWRKNRQQA